MLLFGARLETLSGGSRGGGGGGGGGGGSSTGKGSICEVGDFGGCGAIVAVDLTDGVVGAGAGRTNTLWRLNFRVQRCIHRRTILFIGVISIGGASTAATSSV